MDLIEGRLAEDDRLEWKPARAQFQERLVVLVEALVLRLEVRIVLVTGGYLGLRLG